MVIAVLLVLTISQGTETSTVRDLKQIEQRLAATWQSGDCAAWSAMVAPDWSVIHITGEVITKAQARESCSEPRSASESVTIDDLSVRVFGDAAVVTGRTTASSGGAKPTTVVLRFTDVFVRRSTQWLVVASQATRIGS